jgi:hypothetical protein
MPLPPEPKGEGEHSRADEGLGESQFQRLEKKFSTVPTLVVLLQPVLLLDVCVLRPPVLSLCVSVLMHTLQPFRRVCSTVVCAALYNVYVCYAVV